MMMMMLLGRKAAMVRTISMNGASVIQDVNLHLSLPLLVLLVETPESAAASVDRTVRNGAPRDPGRPGKCTTGVRPGPRSAQSTTPLAV